MSWAREGLPRICRFLFALWGRRVCCLFGKMRIKRCVSSACERQRKAREQKSLTLAPEAQVGLAVTLWPAVAWGRCPRVDAGETHPPNGSQLESLRL